MILTLRHLRGSLVMDALHEPRSYEQHQASRMLKYLIVGSCAETWNCVIRGGFDSKVMSYWRFGFAAGCEAVALRLCQKSDGNDMAAVWITKSEPGAVATGSFP